MNLSVHRPFMLIGARRPRPDRADCQRRHTHRQYYLAIDAKHLKHLKHLKDLKKMVNRSLLRRIAAGGLPQLPKRVG